MELPAEIDLSSSNGYHWTVFCNTANEPEIEPPSLWQNDRMQVY